LKNKVKEHIRKVVIDNTTKRGRYFDYFIQFIILLSLISFSFETLPNLTEKNRLILEGFEVISIVIFSIEYLLRVFVSKKPFKYIFSFYGVIDILAILPFYLNRFLDLRFLRAFRIFRIFRALKLIRYNKALNRFNVAFKIVKEELVLFFIVIIILLFITSAGIYSFENEAQPDVFKSVFHSAWWSIVTLTTVGYGDVYPITLGGKIFTFFVLIIGIGVVAVPAGLVGTALSKARSLEN
jgi:voltage-gated potassium channel